jgi:hypothetical protein
MVTLTLSVLAVGMDVMALSALLVPMVTLTLSVQKSTPVVVPVFTGLVPVDHSVGMLPLTSIGCCCGSGTPVLSRGS